MQVQSLLLLLSSILIVMSPITYVVSIARGKSKPHRMTRFILAFVLTLNFISILAAHGNMGATIFAGIIFAQGLIIFLMSIWRGMGGSSLFDYVCLGIAIVGIIGWKITGNPIVGILFSILADFSAYLPAFIKTWKYPHTESPWYYFLGVLASFFSLIAYKIEVSSLFQIYIMLSSLIMVGFIYHKEIYKFKNKYFL